MARNNKNTGPAGGRQAGSGAGRDAGMASGQGYGRRAGLCRFTGAESNRGRGSGRGLFGGNAPANSVSRRLAPEDEVTRDSRQETMELRNRIEENRKQLEALTGKIDKLLRAQG